MRVTRDPDKRFHSPNEPEQYECLYLKKLDVEARCEFLRNPQCDYAIGSFNYLVFVYCTLAGAEWFGVVLLVLILIFLFLTLGTSADTFFCPSLEAMSSFMRLSQTVAGVTILALGNGAIDMFTSIAAAQIDNGDEMIFGELLGAGLLVTTVVAGCIMLIRPFRVDTRPFLRDCLFVVISASYEFYIFHNERVTIIECVGCLIIYVVYITTAVFEALFVKWKIKKEVPENWIQEQYEMISSTYDLTNFNDDDDDDDDEAAYDEKSLTEAVSMPGMLARPRYRGNQGVADRPVHSDVIATIGREHVYLPSATATARRSGRRRARLDAAMRAERLNVLSLVGLYDEAERERKVHFFDTPSAGSSRSRISRKTKSIFKEFLYELLPFGRNDWKHASFVGKLCLVTEAPIIFVLTLVVPVVSLTAKNCGWSKLLNVMHCATTTMYFCWGVGLLHVQIYYWIHGWMVALLLGSALAALVFVTSSKHRPPVYHLVYAFAGFAASILTLYLVAQDVIALMYTLGVIFDLSDATLGLCLLAFGNSVGDLSANIAIAKAGFEKMGFSACFGGPLFTNMFGLGIALLWSMHKQKQTELFVSYGAVGPTLYLFWMSSTIVCATAILMSGSEARPALGCGLITIYVMFLIFVMLTEQGVIHSYKMYH